MTVADLLDILLDDYVSREDIVVVGTVAGDVLFKLEGASRVPGQVALEVEEG